MISEQVASGSRRQQLRFSAFSRHSLRYIISNWWMLSFFTPTVNSPLRGCITLTLFWLGQWFCIGIIRYAFERRFPLLRCLDGFFVFSLFKTASGSYYLRAPIMSCRSVARDIGDSGWLPARAKTGRYLGSLFKTVHVPRAHSTTYRLLQ